MDDQAVAAAAGIWLVIALFGCVFGAAFYIYFSLALQKIADKTGTPNSWMAWVPIAQAILLIQIAQKELWWIVLLLIPCVNVVIGVILWMEIAKRRGKPDWWGIMMIIPFVNFVFLGLMAFTD